MQNQQPGSKDVAVLGLRKVHIIVGALVALIGPPLVTAGVFYQAKADLSERISRIQLESEREYAKRCDVNAMSEKLNSIGRDVSEIKGYLRTGMRQGR